MSRKIPASQLEAAFSYIKPHLISIFGPDSRDIDFSVLNSAHRRIVMLCKSGNNESVVKMYRRLTRFLNAKRAHDYLSKRGIPCPRLLQTKVCLFSPPIFYKFFIVQERIPGLRLSEIQVRDMALNQIGKVLAEMHNHKRVMWGPLFETPIRNLMRNRKSFLAKRFELAIDRIRELERAGELSRGQAKDLTLSLTTEKSGIPPRSGYELMHDDLNSSNIILREDKPVLIDIDDVRFGDFSYDLFRAERRLCTDDRERHLLRDAYFAAAGRTSLEIYNDSKHFFEMDYHLRCASHCLRRSGGKEREERGSGFHERYRSHREQLMAFIS